MPDSNNVFPLPLRNSIGTSERAPFERRNENGSDLSAFEQNRSVRVIGSRAVLTRELFSPDHLNLVPQQLGVIDGFIRVCERWALPLEKQVVLLGYAGDESGARKVLRGVATTQDIKDRTGYLINICIGLQALFNRSLQQELGWLHHPIKELGNKSPMERMLTGKMSDLIDVNRLVLSERLP